MSRSGRNSDTPSVPVSVVPDAERARVLIVDDREQDVEVLRLVLENDGYDIVTAHSGPELLKHILRDDFAVILLDAILPGMDGFELARIVKQRDRSRYTPIIFLTAMGMEMDFIFRAYSAGAVDYIGKPVQPDVLRAKVRVFAELHMKDRRLQRQSELLRKAELRQRSLELEQLRQASEARYRNLADAIPAVVFRAASDGAIEYLNRRWRELTRLHGRYGEGWSWLDAVHGDDRLLFEARWRRALDSGEPLTAEVRLLCGTSASGERLYRWHICHVEPERGDAGEVVAWLGTLVDSEGLGSRPQGAPVMATPASVPAPVEDEVTRPVRAPRQRRAAAVDAKRRSS